MATQPGVLGGYMAAASFIAHDADGETLIFRKFNKLAALNLLYLQSEMVDLEARIQEMHIHVLKSYNDRSRIGMPVITTASTWETLLNQCDPSHSDFKQDAKDQMDLILRLRSKIQEYHEALALQNNIANLKNPEPHVRETIKDFIESPHHLLGGKATTIFSVENTDDLASLRAPAETDTLSKFLRRNWPGKAEPGRDSSSTYVRFAESSITLTVHLVTVLVAAVFLIGTILGFYFVSRPTTKLGMIAGFTVAFAASIALLTNARRVEIFAATAAYAAVLVVFVSNSDLSSAGAASPG